MELLIHSGTIAPPTGTPFHFARDLVEVKGCSMATLSVPLSLVWPSVYANNPRSVTELGAVGVPGWQAGTKALCLYIQTPQAASPSAGQ